jgi:hypothetical protein
VKQPTVCADLVAHALVRIRMEGVVVHALRDANANCWRSKSQALLPSMRAETNLLC